MFVGVLGMMSFGMSASFNATPMVEAGATFSVALRADGTVWYWGFMGGGLTTTPTKVPLNNIIQVAAGAHHSVALRDDGTVWGWGFDLSQQASASGAGLANNLPIPPTQIPGINDAIYVFAGNWYSGAILVDGTILFWGNSRDVSYSYFTLWLYGTAIREMQGFQHIPVPRYHFLQIRNDGYVLANGINANYQLGDGTTIRRDTPVQVLGGETGDAFFNVFSTNTGSGILPQPANTIFNTRWEANFLNWILFFLGFGWIWMWFA